MKDAYKNNIKLTLQTKFQKTIPQTRVLFSVDTLTPIHMYINCTEICIKPFTYFCFIFSA